MNWQPNTTVRDVLNELYDFRNIIAHGQEILKTVPAEERPHQYNGERINDHDYYRAELMLSLPFHADYSAPKDICGRPVRSSQRPSQVAHEHEAV